MTRKELTLQIFQSLLQLTKTSSFLKPSELSFYLSTIPSFQSDLTQAQESTLSLIQKLMNSQSSKSTVKSSKSIKHVEELLENYAFVSETIDNLLEKAVSFFLRLIFFSYKIMVGCSIGYLIRKNTNDSYYFNECFSSSKLG
jgi:hypothetical protein